MKFSLIFFTFINLLYSLDITIIVPDNVKAKYESYIKYKKPLLLTELPNSNRDIAELIIVQQAIIKGGLKVDKFVIISGPTKLEDTPLWKNMVNLVGKNRIDLLLAPFQSSNDISFVSELYFCTHT